MWKLANKDNLQNEIKGLKEERAPPYNKIASKVNISVSGAFMNWAR